MRFFFKEKMTKETFKDTLLQEYSSLQQSEATLSCQLALMMVRQQSELQQINAQRRDTIHQLQLIKEQLDQCSKSI